LKAFANKNKDVGYCQGMGFVSAIFLTYMNEEVIVLRIKLLTLSSSQRFGC